MGTPLPPEHRKPDGTPYVSGTEWEYCDAIEAVRRLGKPTVLVCRRTEELLVGVRDAKRDEKIRQFEAVEINALAAQVLQGKSANAELLLFADQFEEISSARGWKSDSEGLSSHSWTRSPARSAFASC
jgi:hypothetical protein